MGQKEKNQESGGFASVQNTFAMNDPTISYQNMIPSCKLGILNLFI